MVLAGHSIGVCGATASLSWLLQTGTSSSLRQLPNLSALAAYNPHGGAQSRAGASRRPLSSSRAGVRPQGVPAVASSRRPLEGSSFVPRLGGKAGGEGIALQRRGLALSTRLVVRAQWGKEVVWQQAEVAEAEKVAEQLSKLVIDVSKTDVAAGYKSPGQFVQVKVGDSKPAFLAIASPPQDAKSGRLEFLIKDIEGTTASLLCGLPPGAPVQISPVMGKGFNMAALLPAEDFPTVMLFATGSGISPIRSLIENGFSASSRPDVRLFYGATNLKRMAYQDRFAAWEASGVKVIPVLSNGDDSWQGERGFVQAAFQRQPPLADGSKAGAVLCGQKGMVEETTSLLESQGVAKEKILLNF